MLGRGEGRQNRGWGRAAAVPGFFAFSMPGPRTHLQLLPDSLPAGPSPFPSLKASEAPPQALPSEPQPQPHLGTELLPPDK